jgi:predicted ATPase/DNA-binding winged helix-turn-helix (wHTH) protein
LRKLLTLCINCDVLEGRSAVDDETFVFGPFRLIPAQRMLLDVGKPLRLGSRALEILMVLVERAGETIRKDELIARTWPDTVVEENALRVHVAALRKALGDGRAGNRYIANIPGRGYSFVAPVTRERERKPSATAPLSAGASNNLPTPLTRIVGRDRIVGELGTQFARRRLLTIVGPGGIGKTTVAVAIAESISGSYPDGVWFVGLASLPDPDLVPGALGTVLGISLSGVNPLAGLAAWLRDKQALIVLDSCEHVISAAAAIAEAVLKAAPRVCILATSREPLRAEGEWLHRLPSLELPPAAADLTPDEALQYSAVQLFVERAMASADSIHLADADVPAVLEICRSLDGVPLALEFAAARVEAFGIKGLAARLGDRFSVLTRGRRTALPRHQTLRAAMDWSYDLLPDKEKIILRRLAVFHGDFTMEAAGAVAADEKITPTEVFEGVANLAAKSLVATDISGEVTYYHLLDTTRAYAENKLVEADEIGPIRRLHAEYHRDLFRKAETEAATRPAGDWRGEYTRQIGNLRAALNWAFSDTGDVRLGVTLAAEATDFWLTVSMLSECCDWAFKALAHLGVAEGTRDEMILQCGLGLGLTYVRGMTSDAWAALTRALTLSEALEDFNHRFRALYGLWLFALRVVDFRECLALARKYELLAETIGDPPASATADWMLGMSRYYLGEHAGAAANLQRARATYPIAMRSGDLIRFGTDMQVSALCYQAVTFWSLGFADKAIRAGRDAIKEARGVHHPVSLCLALAAPSSILLAKMGDLEAAERCIDELVDHSDKHSLIPYHAFGLCSKGGLMAARGDLASAERWLRAGLERTREVAYYLFYAFFLGELADVLASAGRIEEGLAEINAALRYAEESESLWCMPEVLRTKGSILAKHDPPHLAAAEHHFVRSLDWARRQQALSWELRAAINLAELWRGQQRVAEARELLGSVYARFTEGFATADLQHARTLLACLA